MPVQIPIWSVKHKSYKLDQDTNLKTQWSERSYFITHLHTYSITHLYIYFYTFLHSNHQNENYMDLNYGIRFL